jgi:hypothetical protein
VDNQGILPKRWWAQWALTTIFCWAIGIFILWFWNSDELVLILYITVPFIVTAIGQGILLRYKINKPSLWILATGIGYVAGSYTFLLLVVITNFTSHSDEISIFNSLFGLLTGLIPAVGQFLILKKLPNAGWWIPTVVFSFTLFATVLITTWQNSIFYSFHDMTFGRILLLIILLPGMALGIPTGIVLQYLLSKAK